MKIAILLSLLLAACGVAGNAKIYLVKPEEGLVRRQDKEVIPFEAGRGYLCNSPTDFKNWISCTGGAVKIYRLQPPRLVRKQANEYRPIAESEGFYCVSPDDWQAIQAKCPVTPKVDSILRGEPQDLELMLRGQL